MVEVYDAAGEPVPGVAILITWSGGDERIFTGLKPELGLGYADYAMTPGEVYALHIAEGGPAVTGLTAQECETTAGGRYWGSWSLIFAQP